MQNTIDTSFTTMNLLFTATQTDEKRLSEKFIKREGFTIHIEYIAYSRRLFPLKFLSPTECRGLRFNVYPKDIWVHTRRDGQWSRDVVESLDPIETKTYGWSVEEGPHGGIVTQLSLGLRSVVDDVDDSDIDEFTEALNEIHYDA